MNLVQMSAAAGILIAGIVIFRLLFIHRLPKKVMVILWEIAILRLLFPFSIALSFPGIGNFMDSMVVDEQIHGLETKVYDTNQDAAEDLGRETAVLAITVQRRTSPFIIIYLAGAALMVSGSVFLYLRDSQLFREGLPMSELEKDRLFMISRLGEKEKSKLRKVKFQISDRTATPVTYGVFRPAVVFPKGIFFKEEKETGFCLRHELVHISNYDNLKKLAAHAALCIHWFNPFVWVMYLLYNRDMELLCDETVVKRENGSRQDYALALLSMAERRSMGFRTGLGFGKSAVKERIVAVMTFKKTTLSGMLAAAVAVSGALTVFITSSAQGSSDREATASNTEYVVTVTDTGDAFEWTGLTDSGTATATVYQMAVGTAENAETSVAGGDVISEDAVSAGTAAEAAWDNGDAWETGDLPTALKVWIEDLMEEFGDYGLSVEFSGDDYQLYYYETPVYFFADNEKQTGGGFSGRVLAREPGPENGYAGVITKHDDNGKIVGLELLSREESGDFARFWRGTK